MDANAVRARSPVTRPRARRGRTRGRRPPPPGRRDPRRRTREGRRTPRARHAPGGATSASSQRDGHRIDRSVGIVRGPKAARRRIDAPRRARRRVLRRARSSAPRAAPRDAGRGGVARSDPLRLVALRSARSAAIRAATEARDSEVPGSRPAARGSPRLCTTTSRPPDARSAFCAATESRVAPSSAWRAARSRRARARLRPRAHDARAHEPLHADRLHERAERAALQQRLHRGRRARVASTRRFVIAATPRPRIAFLRNLEVLAGHVHDARRDALRTRTRAVASARAARVRARGRSAGRDDGAHVRGERVLAPRRELQRERQLVQDAVRSQDGAVVRGARRDAQRVEQVRDQRVRERRVVLSVVLGVARHGGARSADVERAFHRARRLREFGDEEAQDARGVAQGAPEEDGRSRRTGARGSDESGSGAGCQSRYVATKPRRNAARTTSSSRGAAWGPAPSRTVHRNATCASRSSRSSNRISGSVERSIARGGARGVGPAPARASRTARPPRGRECRRDSRRERPDRSTRRSPSPPPRRPARGPSSGSSSRPRTPGRARPAARDPRDRVPADVARADVVVDSRRRCARDARSRGAL